MEIIKRDSGYAPLLNYFDDFFTRDLFNWPSFTPSKASAPKVNIHELDNEFEVVMAAPGMKKEDFKVELDNNRLVISCEAKHEKSKTDDTRYSHEEFNYQSFSRIFQLPGSVDTEKIKARYSDGLLSLNIPKKETTIHKPLKTIKIS